MAEKATGARCRGGRVRELARHFDVAAAAAPPPPPKPAATTGSSSLAKPLKPAAKPTKTATNVERRVSTKRLSHSPASKVVRRPSKLTRRRSSIRKSASASSLARKLPALPSTANLPAMSKSHNADDFCSPAENAHSERENDVFLADGVYEARVARVKPPTPPKPSAHEASNSCALVSSSASDLRSPGYDIYDSEYSLCRRAKAKRSPPAVAPKPQRKLSEPAIKFAAGLSTCDGQFAAKFESSDATLPAGLAGCGQQLGANCESSDTTLTLTACGKQLGANFESGDTILPAGLSTYESNGSTIHSDVMLFDSYDGQLDLSGNIYQSINGFLDEDSEIAPDVSDSSRQSNSKSGSQEPDFEPAGQSILKKTGFPESEEVSLCAEIPPPLPPRNEMITPPPPPLTVPDAPLSSPPPIPPKTRSISMGSPMKPVEIGQNDSGDYAEIEIASVENGCEIVAEEEGVVVMRADRLSSSGSWETISVDSTQFHQLPDEKTSTLASDKTPTGTIEKNEKGVSRQQERRASQPSFDRLLQIKSDIQLNLAKKVGQIKLKVTSSSSLQKSRKEKSKSMFYTASSSSTLTREHNATEMAASVNFPLSDDGQLPCVSTDDEMYGDNWSDFDGSDDGVEVASCSENTCRPQQLPDLVTQSCLASQIGETNNDLQSPTQTQYSESSETTSSGCPENMTNWSGEEPNHTHNAYNSRFALDPPLYQYYMMQENQASSRTVDKVERVDSMGSTDSGGRFDTVGRRRRLVASSAHASQRSLWCELPEVREAGVAAELDDRERGLQEAMFEVVSSEASYLRSLNILITHFMAAGEFLVGKGMTSTVITKQQRKHLFSNILAVRDCAERLLSGLEERLEESLVLNDVCDLLCARFERDFEAYVTYCSNQAYQDRTLKELKAENGDFVGVLRRLEGAKECEGLGMRSFLMLPMQRVTRYPLLVAAIAQRADADSAAFANAQRALRLANQVVGRCNEGARRMERVEQLVDIDRRLRYKAGDNLRKIPLVCGSRYLVKQGELVELMPDSRGTIRGGSKRHSLAALSPHLQKKTRRLYLLLFTDLILVAKRKSNSELVVKNYARRAFVEASPLEPGSSRVPPLAAAALDRPTSHLLQLTLMQTARQHQAEFVLAAVSETDRQRWLAALRPPAASGSGETLYAAWDCPQVRAVYEYAATEEDELQLQPGDLLNVHRKMPDGWLEGERLTDGRVGWFPGSYVEEVLNDHVRARNYRQRLRMLRAAESLQMESDATVASPKTKQRMSRTKSEDCSSNNSSDTAQKGALMEKLRRNTKTFFSVTST